jgi:signal transduction histidine kinase
VALVLSAAHEKRSGRRRTWRWRGEFLRGPAPIEDVRLGDPAGRAVELKARQREIHLASGFDPDCPPARADIGMIERVLENLIENALRHTPAGGDIHIHVAPAGEQVEMRVADTGEGIPAGQIAGVFDRYYQVDRGESGAAGAAGLGLAITRRIVELHGGEIAVESVEGQGATFVVRLPAAGA